MHHRLINIDGYHTKLILLFGKIFLDKQSAEDFVCLEFHEAPVSHRWKITEV